VRGNAGTCFYAPDFDFAVKGSGECVRWAVGMDDGEKNINELAGRRMEKKVVRGMLKTR
jgi:hypothetical protein